MVNDLYPKYNKNTRGTQLDVVALWRSITNLIIQMQEEQRCAPRTNIMKYRLRGGYTVLFPLHY